jgi:hypothetical protein
MISIIILHRNPEYLNPLLQNIENTIGADYELIIIDNKKNEYNIFQGYNLGVERSKGDILCFCHEDILFHTQGWGGNVENHFKVDTIDILGICGGDAFPSCPAPWWNSTFLNIHYANHIDNWKTKHREHIYKNPRNEQVSDVVTVDGAWICVRKSLFIDYRFDYKTFNGFHCYDLDISLFNFGRKRTVVIYDVLIEHFSPGSINKDWVLSSEKLVDKWKFKLPATQHEETKEMIAEYNQKCLLTYCYWMKSIDLPKKEIKTKIKKYIPKLRVVTTEYLLLNLWKIFGYNFFTRLLYKFGKNFISK